MVIETERYRDRQGYINTYIYIIIHRYVELRAYKVRILVGPTRQNEDRIASRRLLAP